jgi:hypothetical protein
VPRLPRPENSRLKALLAEAQMSNKGLARRVVDLAAAHGIAGVRCDHTSVLRWLAAACAAGGEPEQAAHVGRKALDLTVRLSSARSVRYVRDLTRLLRPCAAVPAVRDFMAEVSERLPAAAASALGRQLRPSPGGPAAGDTSWNPGSWPLAERGRNLE